MNANLDTTAQLAIRIVIASTLFSGAALVLLAVLARSTAAARCRFAAVTCLGLAALPLLCQLAPSVTLGVFSRTNASHDVGKVPPAEKAIQTNPLSAVPQAEDGRPSHNNQNLGERTAGVELASTPIGRGEIEAYKSFEAPPITPEPIGGKRLVNWLLGIYAVGLLFCITRLFYQLAVAHRLRRLAALFVTNAIDLGPAELDRMEVPVLQSDVDIPIVAGLWKPAIILPRCASNWNREQLCAAISHELGHINRGDLRVQVGCALVRCFYWPHPLVHAIVKSLQRNAELACDALAVSKSSDAVGYARQLLDIATACGPAKAIKAGVLPLAGLGDLERRVAAILGPALPNRRWLIGCSGLLLAAAFVASIVISPLSAKPLPSDRAEGNQASEDHASRDTENTVAESARAEPSDATEVWHVSGQVVNSAGEPVPNVQIVNSQPLEVQSVSRSDSSGRFSLQLRQADRTHPPYSWFFAEGYAIRTACFPAHPDARIAEEKSRLDGCIIPLPDEEKFAVRVLGPDGDPVENARVSPYYIDIPNGEYMADESTGLSSFAPKGVEEFLAARTDARGVAMLTRLPHSLSSGVQVESPGYGKQVFRFGRFSDSRKLQAVKLEESIESRTVQLGAAGAIEAKVLVDDPSVLEGTRVRITTRSQSTEGRRELLGVASVTLDKSGTILIPEIRAGRVEIDFGWKKTLPFAPVMHRLGRVNAGSTVAVDISVVATREMTGLVRTVDGSPVPGARISFRNRKLHTPPIFAETDSMGRYSVQLAPGDIRRQMFAISDMNFPPKYDYANLNDIELPKGKDVFEAPEIILSPMRSIQGVLRDSNGEPLAGINLTIKDAGSRFIVGLCETSEDGSFFMHVEGRSRSFEKRVSEFEWYEIVKRAEGTKPRVLRELTAIERDPVATVIVRR